MKHTRGTILIAAALLAAALLSGCGLSFYGSLQVPTAVEATDNLVELVEVSWNAVKGADVYYVYRSLNPESEVDTGPYGPVPYRTVTGTALVDTTVDPTTYYYRVSAGRLSNGEESALSEAATGTAVPREIGWQDVAQIFGFTGTVRLTLDRTTPEVVAYALTVPAESGAVANVRRIEEDGTAMNLGGPSEAINGIYVGMADIAAAGSVYLALVAEAPDDIANVRTVYLYRYVEETEVWESLEPAIAPATHPEAPFINLVALDANDLLLSYVDPDGQLVSYQYDGSLSSNLAPAQLDVVGQLNTAAIPGAAALTYEQQTTVDDTTVSAQAIEWNGFDDWGSRQQVYDGSTGDLATGSLAVTIDPVDGNIGVAYADDTGIQLTDRSGGLIAATTDAGFPGLVNLAADWIAVAMQGGVISLFYVDDSAAAGVIAQYNTASGTWETISPDDFTSSAVPRALALAAGGGKLFAAFDDGAVTRIRAYQ